MGSFLYVHVPAQLLSARMNFLLNRRLQPEVACQEVSVDQLDLAQMEGCAKQLAERGLATTVHAPFNGFNPGSSKKRLRKTANQMCRQSLELANALNASLIVFHPGIPYQASEKVQDNWLKNALEFWPPYIEQANLQGTIITIENIYERSSEIFQQLFAELGSENFGHCFDIGHWNIFSEQSLESWFERLGSYIKHLHLHDNRGESDQHLPLGAGQIDFSELFTHAGKLPTLPSMTLEAHKLSDLEHSLQAFDSLKQQHNYFARKEIDG